ncbi:MAG: restriction endonuclease subunit S [Verrucomicrobiaceae bacterium]|nr:MAG: restriction endonuclease subunit S [Verrucomicrobiaceae bacterium]
MKHFKTKPHSKPKGPEIHQGAAMKKGWRTKTLGDVCEVIAGQSPEGKFYNAEGKGMPFYQGKKDFGDKFIEAPTTWTTQTTKIAKEGDILMSVRAPVGPVNFATDEVCIGRGLAAIRSSDELNRDFLFYQLWHLQPEIAGREGAVFASINKAEIEALPLAFAPRTEQHRIVGILDEAFSGLATAKANAEKNLQNARALFESHLHVAHTEKAMLGDLVNIKTGKLDANAAVEGGKFPFFTCSRDIFAIDTYAFDCEAILLAGNNAVGDFNVKHYKGKFNAYQRTYVITVNEKNRVLYRFLYFQMLKSLKKFKAQSVGAGTKFLKLGMIKDLEIELPSLTEQQRMVSTMDSVREETTRLAAIYQQKLAALEALKKSLLHQAFSGEL